MNTHPPENNDLATRIAAAQARQAKREGKTKPGANANSGYGLGMKIVLDLIGGIMVGLVFGLAFDHVFNTRPWGLLIFLGLGTAAGFRLMLRTAEQQAKRSAHEDTTQGSGMNPAKKGQDE